MMEQTIHTLDQYTKIIKTKRDPVCCLSILSLNNMKHLEALCFRKILQTSKRRSADEWRILKGLVGAKITEFSALCVPTRTSDLVFEYFEEHINWRGQTRWITTELFTNENREHLVSFVGKFARSLDWSILDTAVHKLSIGVVLENTFRVNWKTVCTFPRPEVFLRAFAGWLDWEVASLNQTFSVAFILDHEGKKNKKYF